MLIYSENRQARFMCVFARRKEKQKRNTRKKQIVNGNVILLYLSVCQNISTPKKMLLVAIYGLCGVFIRVLAGSDKDEHTHQMASR